MVVTCHPFAFPQVPQPPPGRSVSDQAAGATLWLSRNMLAGS